MIKYEDIKVLHLEPSQVCNARCSVCNRRHFGGQLNPNITNNVLDLNTAKEWFPPEFISNLGSLIICGNLGDPMTTPELVPILEYFMSHNKNLHITMHTNAGARSEQFWKDLATVMHPNGKVVFSVDGLETTNHIYRRGVRWDAVMKSMKAFIENGGNAVWEYLVFRHNKHQIQEARELADSLGVKHFIEKNAYGFDSWKDGRTEYMPVFKDDGSFDYHIYSKDTPDDVVVDPITEIKNSVDVFNHSIKSNINEVDSNVKQNLENAEVSCYTIKNKEIYISADGNVFPCCFFAGRYYGDSSFPNAQLREFLKKFSDMSFNMNDNNLKDIVESNLWKQHIPNSWIEKDLENKIMLCSLFCGKCK